MTSVTMSEKTGGGGGYGRLGGSYFVRGQKKKFFLLTILALSGIGAILVLYSPFGYRSSWTLSDRGSSNLDRSTATDDEIDGGSYWSSWTLPTDGSTEIAVEDPAIRFHRSFPEEVLEWIRSLDRSLQLIVLEPRSVQYLATGRGCQQGDGTNRFRFAVALENGSLHQRVSSSSSNWTIDSKSDASDRFLVLRRATRTILLSVLDDRSKYWYVHGSDREFNGTEIGGREPPRAFFGLNTTRFEANGRILRIPSPVGFYLWQWPKSRFLECNRTSAERLRRIHPEVYSEPPVISDSFVDELAQLRDLVIGQGLTLMLSCGTALGWYRECGIIPHTGDMDTIFLASEWKPEMEEIFKTKSRLKLITMFGRPSDSLEMTFSGHGGKVDLFALYEDGDRTYISGMIAWTKTKLRWYFPRFQGACTCDLKGHLFFVRCDTVPALTMEYGPEWYEIHHNKNFSWSSSHRNVKQVGKYSDAEWPQVFRRFE